MLRSQHRSLHYSSSSSSDDDSTLFDEARVEKNKGNKGNNLILVLNWKIVLLLSVTDYQGCAGRSFFQRGGAGRGEEKNPRGGAKKRVDQLIQKFGKSA